MAAPPMAMAPLLSEGGSRVLTAVRAASRADCWAGGRGGPAITDADIAAGDGASLKFGIGSGLARLASVWFAKLGFS